MLKANKNGLPVFQVDVQLHLPDTETQEQIERQNSKDKYEFLSFNEVFNDFLSQNNLSSETDNFFNSDFQPNQYYLATGLIVDGPQSLEGYNYKYPIELSSTDFDFPKVVVKNLGLINKNNISEEIISSVYSVMYGFCLTRAIQNFEILIDVYLDGQKIGSERFEEYDKSRALPTY